MYTVYDFVLIAAKEQEEKKSVDDNTDSEARETKADMEALGTLSDEMESKKQQFTRPRKVCIFQSCLDISLYCIHIFKKSMSKSLSF